MRIKKTLVLTILAGSLAHLASAQGWVGSSTTNSLYAVGPNGLALPGPRISVGTATPSAQLHTTGTVRFQGFSGLDSRLTFVDLAGNLNVLANGLPGQVLTKNATGFEWTTLPSAGGGGWLLGGNLGTNPLLHYLGTGDDRRLIFKTNAIERMTILNSSGNVGIGTPTPTAQFHSTGTVRLGGIAQDNTLTRVMVQNAAGDVRWRDAATLLTSWTLNGNTGTNNATDFLGTTDNTRFSIRTNSVERLTAMGSGHIGIMGVHGTALNSYVPGNLTTIGRDVVGGEIPQVVVGSVDGLSFQNVQNNQSTLGRLVRYQQVQSNSSLTLNNTDYYDLGIDVNRNFFISERSYLASAAPNKVFMIAQSENLTQFSVGNDAVGINLGVADENPTPTANFHTNGTVRHQNLPTGVGNVVVIDSDGNLMVSNSGNGLTQSNSSVDALQKEVAELRKELNSMRGQLSSGVGLTLGVQGKLFQNVPNPFDTETKIKYSLPSGHQNAVCFVYDMNGKQIKKFDVSGQSTGEVIISANELTAGMYIYSLLVDGVEIGTNRMILTQ